MPTLDPTDQGLSKVRGWRGNGHPQKPIPRRDPPRLPACQRSAASLIEPLTEIEEAIVAGCTSGNAWE